MEPKKQAQKMSLEFKHRVIEDIMVADLKGRMIDKSHASDLLLWVDANIEKDAKKFLFNLGGLEFINSDGLNLFIKVFTRVRNNGGELAFCCVSKKVSELLLITKLNNILSIKSSEEEAVKFLKS